MSLPTSSTTPNGGSSDLTFRYDANSTKFPTRKELPQIEGTPPGAAWFWGPDDNLGRLNLLTESRVKEAAKCIVRGKVIPLNLPFDVPKVPAFGREEFKHEIKLVHAGVAFDDLYTLNTQSSSQLDGFRHFAHIPTGTWYNNTKEGDIVGPNANEKCSMHHWAEHGIVGRALLLDYYSFANATNKSYDPYTNHRFAFNDLALCGKAQGIDIRPVSQGGDVLPGDILLVRGGFVDSYYKKTPEEQKAGALRDRSASAENGLHWAGVSQEEENVEWLHDCYFSAVASDMPSFEAWPTNQKWFLHEYLLACWGVPIGEMWDLEQLSETCREEKRWWVFLTSAPANVHRGVSSHGNLIAIL